MLTDKLRLGTPVGWHYADVFAQDGQACLLCHELAFEAWERMTYGGWQLTPWEYLRWCSTYVEAIAEGVNSLTPLKEFFDAAR